ncbi:tRNA (adenosine(37)-N6)-threonylcarbamoyltransferase complex dimerization subunit type 1 TsaB [Jonquetella anthropi]|uniref:tRNA (adenosine(37)-N6)-threonylcarbamoyltransferase complex dimerization subunit type 1 TsaB n=1 Tax=Jonquetella anthropi TaxID=428712 RepID=UPI0001B90F8F|nr:tRNA (adenosine(37)-N6)-threonylcarbamoyltransferase complex dimerization subunit type 1 TsaB [Jonquetella anthropi]EEX48722.1 universal bacterial protein YeaZ [Jonquetella anthropi E3_33 E1]
MATETILSIDCANRWTCLGLWRNGPVGQMELNLGRRQAAQLPLAVEALMNLAEFQLSGVTAVALTVGPGYFTALRIGLAYGSALAFALGVPVVPLSSLEVLARSFPADGLVVPLIAASRSRAFSGAWLHGRQVLEEAERSREELDAALSGFKEAKYLVAAADERLFSEGDSGGITVIPSASGTAAAGLGFERREEAVSPGGIRARYLREPGLGRSV